jgi:hypothetical protein
MHIFHMDSLIHNSHAYIMCTHVSANISCSSILYISIHHNIIYDEKSPANLPLPPLDSPSSNDFLIVVEIIDVAWLK